MRLLPLMALLVVALACRDTRPRPPLEFAPDQLPNASVGQPYSAIISVSQNVTPVFQMSAPEADLPPGLTITLRTDHNSGEISGTPTQAGTFRFTVTAACYGTSVNGQVGQKTYTLVVK